MESRLFIIPSQFMGPDCFQMAFAKQWLASADFWGDKKFFWNWNLFEFRIVILNLHCYPLVAFCRLSPEFASCYQALQKHMVNKNLSTLAPLLFFSH